MFEIKTNFVLSLRWSHIIYVNFLKYLSRISVKYCLWSYLYLNDLNILLLFLDKIVLIMLLTLMQSVVNE